MAPVPIASSHTPHPDISDCREMPTPLGITTPYFHHPTRPVDSRNKSRLKIIIVLLVGKRHGSSLVHLLLVGLEEGLIDDSGRGGESGRGDEFLKRVSDCRSRTKQSIDQTYQRGVSDKLAGKPEEGLFEVVVGLGRDVVVLEVLLAVECDGLGLDLALLDVDLVAAENDGDVLAHAREVAMPVGHVLVCDARRHVEHDDAALAVDVVTITETTKLLLTGGVPHIELDLAKVLRTVRLRWSGAEVVAGNLPW